MRNKGFFWFLTALLAIVCVYQLSFTYVSNSEEKKAEKEAKTAVAEDFAEYDKNGDSVLRLPNGTKIYPEKLGRAEAEELAFSAHVNHILKGKADKVVFSLFGSTFKETKKRSLAFGLDLVGGMSVTMEISVPQMIEGYDNMLVII